VADSGGVSWVDRGDVTKGVSMTELSDLGLALIAVTAWFVVVWGIVRGVNVLFQVKDASDG